MTSTGGGKTGEEVVSCQKSDGVDRHKETKDRDLIREFSTGSKEKQKRFQINMFVTYHIVRIRQRYVLIVDNRNTV